MRLYKLEQVEVSGYDTYSHCVVCAESEAAARSMNPDSYPLPDGWTDINSGWASTPDKVTVTFIGEAVDDLTVGIICYSFHAG